MKYYKDPDKKRFGYGFYIALALCLLVIGGASWFALSGLSDFNNTDPNESSGRNESSQQQEWTDPSTPTPSIPITPPDPEPDTGPMHSPESEDSQTDDVTASKPDVPAFTLPAEGKILKAHSATELQFSSTFGDMRLHAGLDIACKEGTSVSACSSGKVTDIREDAFFGTTVTIDHGSVEVVYAALKDLKVKKGDKVTTGDIIGLSATVPGEMGDEDHIHIEVLKNGQSVDPIETFGLG